MMFFRVVCDQSTSMAFGRGIVSRIWFRINQRLPRFARIDREHRKHLVSPSAVISALNLSRSITGRGKGFLVWLGRLNLQRTAILVSSVLEQGFSSQNTVQTDCPVVSPLSYLYELPTRTPFGRGSNLGRTDLLFDRNSAEDPQKVPGGYGAFKMKTTWNSEPAPAASSNWTSSSKMTWPRWKGLRVPSRVNP